MTSLILPSADMEMMNLFLEHVSSTYAKYFVVMQVDQASWHGAKELRIPDNIRLIAQPAYSPERESRGTYLGRTARKAARESRSFLT